MGWRASCGGAWGGEAASKCPGMSDSRRCLAPVSGRSSPMPTEFRASGSIAGGVTRCLTARHPEGALSSRRSALALSDDKDGGATAAANTTCALPNMAMRTSIPPSLRRSLPTGLRSPHRPRITIACSRPSYSSRTTITRRIVRTVAAPPPGKIRITVRLDDAILALFRSQVEQAGGGNYQTLINDSLRHAIATRPEPLERVVRRVVREELARKPIKRKE